MGRKRTRVASNACIMFRNSLTKCRIFVMPESGGKHGAGTTGLDAINDCSNYLIVAA